MGKSGYVVIIEWDGGRPPSTWYNRMAKLGLTVRGDKSRSPLERRRGRHGVTHQEGAIVVASESEARLLGHLAQEMGAKDVTVGILSALDMSMTDSDREVLDHVSKTLGKRGRPTRDEKNEEHYWAITCLDEMVTQVIRARDAVNCPTCGSFHVHARLGGLTSVPPMKPDEDVWTYWLNSRFVNGMWESPITLESAPVPPERKQESLSGLVQLPLIRTRSALGIAELKKIPANILAMLDAAFCIAMLPEQTRQQERIRVIYEHVARTGSEEKLQLLADSTKMDIFDLAIFDKRYLTYAGM